MSNKIIFSKLLIIFISINIFCSFKPKYVKQIYVQFGVIINKNTIKLNLENEKWFPNGDGFYLSLLTLKNSSEIEKILNQKKFVTLPIKEDLPVGEIYNKLKSLENGYYLLEVDKEDPRDFKILTLNTTNKEIIFYYQYY